MENWRSCILTGCRSDKFFVDLPLIGLYIETKAREPIPAPDPYKNSVIERLFTEKLPQAPSRLKQVWLQPDIDTARTYADRLIDDYENRFPEAARILEEGLEDSLQFYSFHRMDARKISSTNILERLNREIRRRTNVVGVFPNMDSYIRLVTSHLIEYSEDWSAGKAYIHPEKIALIQEKRLMAA